MTLFPANLRVISRFDTQQSAVNKSLGLYFQSVKGLRVRNIGVSIYDSTGSLYNTASGVTGWSARLAVVLGIFQDDPTNFTPDYDLTNYIKKLDTSITSFEAFYPFSSDDTPMESDRGEGLSVLLATPKIFGSGSPTPLVTVRLFGAGGSAGGGIIAGAAAAGGGSASTTRSTFNEPHRPGP